MTDHSELIERLKVATGPDRELDVDIGLSFGWTAAPVFHARRQAGSFYRFDDDSDDPPEKFLVDTDNGFWKRPDGVKQLAAPPPFTASIDACLALMELLLPGWRYDIHSPRMGQRFEAVLMDGDSTSRRIVTAHAETATLALLLALFSALGASNDQ